jgi:hypothetical protein
MPATPSWPTAGAPTSGTIPSSNLIAIINYYVARLIFQYADKPNAQRLIAILAKQAAMDDLATLVLGGFDLDSAVGPQLDILGKYIGASRLQGSAISPGYFSLWTYASPLNPNNYQGTWDPASNNPPVPPATPGTAGYWYVASASGASTVPTVDNFVCGDCLVSDGTSWSRDTNDCGNGLTDYSDLSINANATFYGYGQATVQINSLADPAYRIVLQLRALVNTSDGTLPSINKALATLFPKLIYIVDNQNMTLTYYVASTITVPPAVLALVLPKPMGVGINIVIFNPSEGEITTEDGTPILTESGLPITTEPS